MTHYFSIDNARRDMNYAPTITTEEGARQMADFYRYTLTEFAVMLDVTTCNFAEKISATRTTFVLWILSWVS